MRPCIKFQSIWRTLEFGTKSAKKNIRINFFLKNKHQNRNKHVAMYPCTKFQSIWKLQTLGPNLSKKI